MQPAQASHRHAGSRRWGYFLSSPLCCTVLATCQCGSLLMLHEAGLHPCSGAL